jgi:uncharacterized membrane protein HdeD (DUF308 family)
MQTIINDIKKHYAQYLILLSGLCLGILGFFALAGLPIYRIMAVIFIGSFYVCWGTIHHILDKDFHIKTFLEYLLMAILGCAILLSLILRG